MPFVNLARTSAPEPAHKIVKHEFVGTGTAVQAVGFLALFFWPIGTIIGVVLLIAGSVMSRRLICSECRENVDRQARLCPRCGTRFSP